MQTNEANVRQMIDQALAQERKLAQEKAAQTRSRNRFVAVLAMSVFVLILALVPIGAMFASSANLLADTGIDGVTNKDLIDALYPIGSIYMTTNTNLSTAAQMNTAFAGTTWEAWSTGRVPLGMGSFTDGNNDAINFNTVNSSGTNTMTSGTANVTTSLTMPKGNYRHKLVTNELAAHNHTQAAHNHLNVAIGATGSGTWGLGGYQSNGSTFNTGQYTGNATPTINNNGGDYYHNNLPPYTTCYMWRRTA